MSRKNRTFILLDIAHSGTRPTNSMDEVSVFNLINLCRIIQEAKKFLDAEFSLVKFCYDRRRQNPALGSVSTRILASLAFSSASERV